MDKVIQLCIIPKNFFFNFLAENMPLFLCSLVIHGHGDIASQCVQVTIIYSGAR